MALNFADRLVSNNPSAYGIVRAIEVSGHKTVSSLSALYKIPDCILSDTGDNSGNDSLGQLWYVIDAKEVYQLVNWEKRNEAGGWKPYLSGVITDEALEEILNTKQDKLIAGEGISISEDNVISCTIDTSLFRMVDELPSLEEAETNKIYLLRKENNIGELQSYTEYIVTIKVDEEGKEIKEWEKIGEYDLSIELAPYLKIEDAEKTYVKKENIVDSFEGGDPKEQVLSAEKGKELKELVDSLEERKVDSVTATEGKGIIVEGTHNDPTIGVLRDPESEGFFTIEETGLKLSGVQDAIDEAVGELTDRVELESDVVYNINEIFPGEGKGENGDQWHIQYAAAKLDAFLPAEKKVPGIKVKFINLDGNWRTFTFNGGYFLDGRNWSYDITSNDFTELATENLPTATPESNGVMSKEDKAKLDGISETINKDVDDKIAEVKETIDNYTVNGYKISTNPSLDRNDIGLGNVTNDAQIKRSEMGVPKGVATLGEDGKVPESQLPDSVLGNVKYQGVWDAVNNVPKLELNDFDSNGHYYIAINKGSQFGYDFDPGDWVINSNGRWVKIDNVDSVKSVNGQIGIVELGIEDIPNLKETLDSKATNDDFNRHLTDYKNPHKVTKDQVGLGNVDNTADKDKPVSDATQALIDQTRTVLENKISELQTNTEADLEVFRSEFENKLAELAAKEEADIVAVNNSLKEAKTELQNNIDNLASKTENDLTVAKKELDNKISELSTKTESDLSTLRADLESSISVTKTELEKSISELASKTENDLNTAKSELEKAISDLTAKEEADIVAVNNALSEAKKELENSISSLASKTENDLSLATKDLNNKISELATKTESDLSTLRADLESSISVTKTDLESKITELATKTDAKFQATDSKIEATKTELQTNIDNLSHRHDDDMKDIRREIEEATAGSNEALNTHIQDKSNPHQVTKEQVGLGNVTDDAQVKRSEMGMPEGVATLDATGKVPSSQLPSFVDDVIEVDSFDLLPETGETGKIYVTKDTNLTYRWSGSQYVEISESLALGETSSTAYPGDKGKATTDKVNAHTSDYNNPHKVDKAQVGLGNVDNTADLDKPVSNATQELVDNTKKELEEKINNSGNDLQDNIDKIDERVTNIEDSIAQPGGLATLDDAGKVPLEQLPSLVDDIIEVDSFEHLPEAGEVGKIYVTKDTNLLYRWTGVKYVEVSESLHLGETADTAYAGDKGKETTDKVNSHISDFNNPHKVTAEQVGLGNVDNTSDINKPVSTAQQEALDAVNKEVSEHKADKNNPHEVTKAQVGLGNVDNTADLDKPVSNATQELVDNTKKELDTKIDNHTSDFNNPHKVTKEQVGLGNVDNTADINKPVSVAQQALVDSTKAELKKDIGDIEKDVTNHIADKNNPHEVNKLQVGLGNVDNTSDINKPVSIAQQAALDKLKSDLESIIGSTGTDLSAHLKDFDNPHKVTKDQVGLGKVDNTADLEKPVSVATQEAINAVQSNLDKTNISLENHIADKKNPHEVTKEQVGLGNVDNTSDLDKPVSHYQQDALDELERRLQGSIDGSGSDLSAHISDFNNPHKVTKDQVGLGNVDNTADKDKPISDATQKALDSIKTETNTIIETHIADKNNPHEVTKEQIGLGEVTNDAQVKRSEMGVAGGVATLDQEGKVPSSQLPSFVDDVIEVDSYDNLPTTGEAGKIYVTKDTNLTYRWSGSRYIEISASLALGETSSTAYPGDKGKETTDKVNVHVADFNNPHQVNKEQVGLGNVDNTSDLDKPVSNATQELVDKTKEELTDLITSNEGGLSDHIKDFNNPHKVTKEQVGLGNVDNTSDADKPISNATQEALDKITNNITNIEDKLGQPNGIATLDPEGKVPSSQLPSYVDDVIEVDSFDLLPETGETGKIYVTKDTNLTYRWSGSRYIEISASLALGETSSTAYPGDKGKATTDKVNAHTTDFNNPHKVDKTQVGLGNVDNTSDKDKPVSDATQKLVDDTKKELEELITSNEGGLSDHIKDFNNPHKVTAEQIGLGNVDNTADLDKPISNATQEALDNITNNITNIEEKIGKPDGIASLDSEGKVPASQLPSYVDDVIEVDSYDNLPVEGEAGKIYVTKDTNLTYRWSGTKYTEISASLALGETSSTAYAGDKGKATTDKLDSHVIDYNNPHKVDKTQVGLGNVDNTSDKDKPVSDATLTIINEVKESINSGNTTITDNLNKHISDYNNPHKVTKDQVGLGNVDNTADKDKPLSDAVKEAIKEVKDSITSSGTDLSAHIKDYTNPHRVTKDQVGLGNVENTADLDKPISTATQKELDKLDAKIDKINTDQGTNLSDHIKDFNNPHKVTKDQVGLGNVDNTADKDKPISTATQKAIDDAIASGNTALGNHANRTDNPHKVTADQVGLGNVDNTADINKPVSVAQQNALDTLSNSLNTAINNHVGNTNNPHQVTKEQVGLGKVDNTSDLEKPISVATQNAISEVVSNLDKHIADKNNPHEVTKEQIGLGRVDNTSDLEKPISTATQVALDKKAELGPDGKIPESQLPERTMHSLFYKGTWDAERNLPTLANGDKAQDGDYYLVNNDGESFGYKFMVNDIIFNASGIWYRMMGSNKRDNPTEFKITKFTADRTLLERGESTEITLEWEYQLTPSGQINFQLIDTHDIPVEERTYKITATGGQTFTLRGSYLSEVATATLTIDTADKVYVGASSNSAPTDSDFIAMNSFFSFGDNEFPFTPIDCSGGKYIYVAIPTEEYSKYRIYCNNYPVDDVTVYSRRITNIFTGYTDYTITKLANLYHGILNIEVKLIDKR